MRCDLNDFFFTSLPHFITLHRYSVGFFFLKENRLLRNVQIKYMLSSLHSCYINLRKLYTLNDFLKIPTGS